MSEQKKAIYNISVSKALGNSEQMQVTMAGYEGESLDDIATKVNFAFDMFGARIKFNNDKMLEMQKEYEEQLKATKLRPVE